KLEDSTLVARKLANANLALVAAPAYLDQHGLPESAVDLRHHNCLIDTVPDYANHWPIFEKPNAKPITVQGNVQVNSGEIIRSLTLAGVGIALLPRFLVHEEIHSGRLTSLLEGNIKFTGGIFAIYPKHRQLSTNVRSFIDYLLTKVDQLSAFNE
ncbi:MAG: LysR family transcriptional regulator, partial [Gammaproteobacteria bacterium]|nr:LysR family transcriptional regulator [Gammaproteobacteria bacterium]